MLAISLETKLSFDNPEDKKELTKAMYLYTAMVKYGIKTLKPKPEQQKETYKILTEKFEKLPARTITIAVHSDIAGIINSYNGLEAKNYPLTMRFDKDNSEFFIDT